MHIDCNKWCLVKLWSVFLIVLSNTSVVALYLLYYWWTQWNVREWVPSNRITCLVLSIWYVKIIIWRCSLYTYNIKLCEHSVASELKDPIWHSLEWQIGFFSSEATICYVHFIRKSLILHFAWDYNTLCSLKLDCYVSTSSKRWCFLKIPV